MSDNNCAVLVLSTDSYSDLWHPFFSFFFKYWPNCPYPVYLSTNTLKYPDSKVKTLNSNIETSWSDELLIVLEQIKERYLILILEDYFIYKKVDNKIIDHYLSVAERNNAAFLKLACFPSKYRTLCPYINYKEYKDIAEIPPDAQYRIDTQIAIWDKEILYSLLVKTESPWEFEINASVRSAKINLPFLTLKEDPKIKYVHGPITYYCTAVSAGKWMRGAIKLCKKEGISVDLTKRETETGLECVYREFYISLPISLRKIVDFLCAIFSNKKKKTEYS